MKKKYYCYNRHVMIAFILVVLFYVSCTNAPTNPTSNTVVDNPKNAAQQKPSSTFKDTIIINVTAAVFYNPDSLQLDKIKAITDKDILESNVHDCFFQIRNSRIVLKKYYPAVKIIEVKNARYLSFIKDGGEKEYIDLNTKNDPCGLFIFNGKKAPLLVDMTNIETELGFYFSN